MSIIFTEFIGTPSDHSVVTTEVRVTIVAGSSVKPERRMCILMS